MISQPTAVPESDPDVVRGRDLITAQKYAEAIPVLEKAVAAEPKNADANYYLGLAYDQSGKKTEAEAKYKAALELKPSLLEAAQNLASIYLEDPPRPDDAIPLLRKALQAAPNDATLLQNIAYAYGLKKDVGKASKAYDLALQRDDSFKVHFAYGTMLFENGQMDRAVTELTKAASSTEDIPTLASISRMMGNAKAFDQCVKILDRVIAKKSDSAEMFARRGTCKHELKDEPGAEGDFREAIKAEPKLPAAHYLLGQSLIAQGKKPEAKVELKKAFDLDPTSEIGKLAKKILDKLK
jgi:Flp pilus assembly protein TadD